MTGRLPTKLSGVVRVGIKAVLEVRERPGYTVHMTDNWHAPRHSRCHVCFAGAIMAQRFGTDNFDTLYPGDFPAQQ